MWTMRWFSSDLENANPLSRPPSLSRTREACFVESKKSTKIDENGKWTRQRMREGKSRTAGPKAKARDWEGGQRREV